MEHKGIGTLHRYRQDLGDFSWLEKTRKKGGAELNWALLGIKNTSCLSRRSCPYPAAWIIVKEQHLKLGHWGASPGGTNHCWAMAGLTVKLVSGPDLTETAYWTQATLVCILWAHQSPEALGSTIQELCAWFSSFLPFSSTVSEKLLLVSKTILKLARALHLEEGRLFVFFV